MNRRYIIVTLIIICSLVALCIAAFFLIGLTGFGPGPADYSSNLPGGYMLFRSSANEISIIPAQSWNPNNPPPMIPAKVVAIAYDSKYILAKRYELIPDPKHLSSGYQIPDETKQLYYILDTSIPLIYQFSNINDFDKKKAMLKISKTLNLKDVSSI